MKLIEEHTVLLVFPATFEGIICQPMKVGIMNVAAMRYIPHLVHL